MAAPFKLLIADFVFLVHPVTDAAQVYCQDYLTQAPEDYTIALTQADLDREWEIQKQAAQEQGLPADLYSDVEIETAAIHRQIIEILMAHDTLVFHGSCIAVDGEAYVFTALSGTGKSTHTHLWCQTFGPRAEMVNDDKPMLHITDSGVTAYGTPWNGKHRIGAPIARPLKAICLLQRSGENHIQPLAVREGYPMLLQQLYWPEDPALLSRTLVLLDRLMAQVPFYRLGCNMDPEAALVSYRGMNGGTDL